MAQSYDRSFSRFYSGMCGSGFIVTAGDSKQGATQPPPYLKPLPYKRSLFRREPGLVRYNGMKGTSVHCHGPIDYQQAHLENWQIILANRLADKVRGHSFNTAVTLGEARESMQLIGDTSRLLAKGVGGISKQVAKYLPRGSSVGHFGKKAALVSELWLTFVYGVKPLLSDTEEAARALAAIVSRPASETYRASVSQPLQGVSSAPSLYQVGGGGKRVYYAIVTIRESAFRLPFNGQLNLTELAYELTPYSFVADWVYPFGNWLRARNFLADLEYDGVYGYYEHGRVFEIPTYSGGFVSAIPQSLQWVAMERHVGAIPVPLPSLNTKGLDSWRHCVDGLALLAVGLRRLL